MKRTIVLVLAVMTGGGAVAQETPPASPAFTKKPPAAPPKPKSEAPKYTPAQEKLRALDRAKARFMAAMGSCAKPEECDPESPRRNVELVTLLKSAEDAFIEACAQCATDKVCEEERTRIRAGRGRFGTNVCAPPPAKGSVPPTSEKKSSPAAKPAAPAATPTK